MVRVQAKCRQGRISVDDICNIRTSWSLGVFLLRMDVLMDGDEGVMVWSSGSKWSRDETCCTNLFCQLASNGYVSERPFRNLFTLSSLLCYELFGTD